MAEALDKLVAFRASQELAAAIRGSAHRSELSSSEFMRRILRARARLGIETSAEVTADV